MSMPELILSAADELPVELLRAAHDLLAHAVDAVPDAQLVSPAARCRCRRRPARIASVMMRFMSLATGRTPRSTSSSSSVGRRVADGDPRRRRPCSSTFCLHARRTSRSRLTQVALGRDDRADLVAGHDAQVVDREDVRRVGHRDDELVVLERDRQHRVARARGPARAASPRSGRSRTRRGRRRCRPICSATAWAIFGPRSRSRARRAPRQATARRSSASASSSCSSVMTPAWTRILPRRLPRRGGHQPPRPPLAPSAQRGLGRGAHHVARSARSAVPRSRCRSAIAPCATSIPSPPTARGARRLRAARAAA